jgi:hypothetical protein
MKRLTIFLVVCFLMIANNMFAQQTNLSAVTDSTGLPGDNFSLQGALEMFKQSKTPEEFEKKLNSENNYVNNLDLNDDGKIDYVRVVDKMKGDIHAIVLQVTISNKESQDVAVIEIEKLGKESAMLQIVGDPELYGDSTYVEPVEAKGEKTKGAGPSASLSSVDFFFVNVWFWPCVTYIYQPVYVVYVSPWYYDYYPIWWSPWRPMPWYRHHHYCYDNYYGYRPVYVNRIYNAHDIYWRDRRSSPSVGNHYQNAHQQYQNHRTQLSQNGNINNNINGKGSGNAQMKPVNSNQNKLNSLENKQGNNQGKMNNYNNRPVENKIGKSGNNNSGKFDNSNTVKSGNNNIGKSGNNDHGKTGNLNQNKPGNYNQNNGINRQQNNQSNFRNKPGNNIQQRNEKGLQQRPSQDRTVKMGNPDRKINNMNNNKNAVGNKGMKRGGEMNRGKK